MLEFGPDMVSQSKSYLDGHKERTKSISNFSFGGVEGDLFHVHLNWNIIEFWVYIRLVGGEILLGN